MLAGLSSRRYTAGLEPPGQVVDGAAAATSRSAVSRRFVAATETALAELMARRLDDLDLVAFMVDGVHFGEYTCVVALGIGIDGTKHPLAVEEGSTENATLVTDLITGLRDRGPDVTKPILAVLHRCSAESLLVSGELDVSTPRSTPATRHCSAATRQQCHYPQCLPRRRHVGTTATGHHPAHRRIPGHREHHRTLRPRHTAAQTSTPTAHRRQARRQGTTRHGRHVSTHGHHVVETPPPLTAGAPTRSLRASSPARFTHARPIELAQAAATVVERR